MYKMPIPKKNTETIKEKRARQEKYFSWYPGHIAKAEQELREKFIPLVDIIIELVDSRVPLSGRYNDRSLFRNKPIITIYTKGDLSNLRDFMGNELIIDSRNKRWRSKLSSLIKKVGQPIMDKVAKQGRKRNLRIGICGFPNVGKSTFMNSLLDTRKKVKTGNKPGVTRQMQFIAGDDFDLLDTPGICPIRIEHEQAFKLAVCNLLPDKLFDDTKLAKQLLTVLQEKLGVQYNLTCEKSAHLLIKKFKAGDYKLVLDSLEKKQD